MEDNYSKAIEDRICVVCGKTFSPHDDADECCSAFCRSMRRAMVIDEIIKQEQSSKISEIENLTEPPQVDLEVNPRARVEWFMSLPDKYKPRFSGYLTPWEVELARGIAHKDLVDERFFSGFFVKNGKVIETKNFSESNNDDTNNRDTNGGDEDDD